MFFQLEQTANKGTIPLQLLLMFLVPDLVVHLENTKKVSKNINGHT